MNEETIKNEMRLFALESIVCQHVTALYQTMPREMFDAAQKQAVAGTQRPIFRGAAATSDLLSAEFQTALERLYGMIQHWIEQRKGGVESSPARRALA
jgi:hypothetical protein